MALTQVTTIIVNQALLEWLDYQSSPLPLTCPTLASPCLLLSTLVREMKGGEGQQCYVYWCPMLLDRQ